MDVNTLSLIKQDDVNKQAINNLQFINNYDSPDPRMMSCASVNNYVNNNNCAHKDRDGYEIPVNKTFVI